MQELVQFSEAAAAAHGDDAAALLLQRVFRHLFELPPAANTKLGATFFATALRHLTDSVAVSKGQQVRSPPSPPSSSSSLNTRATKSTQRRAPQHEPPLALCAACGAEYVGANPSCVVRRARR